MNLGTTGTYINLSSAIVSANSYSITISTIDSSSSQYTKHEELPPPPHYSTINVNPIIENEPPKYSSSIELKKIYHNFNLYAKINLLHKTVRAFFP